MPRRKTTPRSSGVRALGRIFIGKYRNKPVLQALSFKHSGINLVTLLLALVTLSLLFNFVHQLIRSSRLETRRIAVATEVALLEAENNHLKDTVEYAESDAYVERIAREQLGYAREGDVVVFPQFLVPTPLPSDMREEPVLQPPAATEPNWQRWWDALFAPDSAGEGE